MKLKLTTPKPLNSKWIRPSDKVENSNRHKWVKVGQIGNGTMYLLPIYLKLQEAFSVNTELLTYNCQLHSFTVRNNQAFLFSDQT